MLNKTRAIVLHHVKYGESGIIANLYTETHGRLAAIVSGVRSGRPDLPMTFFQPLTQLEVDLYHKGNREVQRLKEASCALHYSSIPFVVTKSTVAIFLAEVLMHTLREEEANPSLFGFLSDAFRIFDGLAENYSGFHLGFLLHYAGYLGFSPGEVKTTGDLDMIPELAVFRNLSREESLAVVQMMNTPPETAGQVKLGHESRAVVLDRIMNYYDQHVTGMGKIRSRQVLRDIFRD